MFKVPVCRSIAVAAGASAAMGLLVASGVTANLTIGEIWSATGAWHVGGVWIVLERYVAAAMGWWDGRIPLVFYLHGSTLFTLLGALLGIAAAFTLLNAAIALLAWRSSGALRGILCHFLIAGLTAALAFVWAISFFWILHWLNFWILLVLFLFIEAKRREPVYVTYTL